MKLYTVQSILGPLFKLLEAMFELFVPLVVADLVDYGIASGDKGYILQRFGLLIALGVIGITCSLIAQYFAARAAVGCTTHLRHALFEHIGKLSFTDKDLTHAVVKLTRNMVNKNSGFVTVISGEDVTAEDAEAVCEALRAKLGNSVEVTHVEGGQPVYYYMISVE